MSTSPQTDLAVIILAAGKGTRMQTELPKVMVPLLGEPMLGHVLRTTQSLNPTRTVVITGYGADVVEPYVAQHAQNAVCARQTEQLGTGHAVKCAGDALEDFSGDILILFGDAPLITAQSLQNLLAEHRQAGNAITTISGHLADPMALGRIQRDNSGKFTGTKEFKDCTPEEAKNTEVATAIFAAQSAYLWNLLSRIDNKNAKGEYYLNSIEPLALSDGLGVDAMCVDDVYPLVGCNTPEELTAAEAYCQNRAAA